MHESRAAALREQPGGGAALPRASPRLRFGLRPAPRLRAIGVAAALPRDPSRALRAAASGCGFGLRPPPRLRAMGAHGSPAPIETGGNGVRGVRQKPREAGGRGEGARLREDARAWPAGFLRPNLPAGPSWSNP